MVPAGNKAKRLLPVNRATKKFIIIIIIIIIINLSVCCAEICKQFVHLFLIGQKSLHDWFRSNLPNDGKQKQVKATEVYLLKRMTDVKGCSVINSSYKVLHVRW